MAYYTQEQIEKARQMDLLTYLQNYEPQELCMCRERPTAPGNMTA